jgi:hypothetical protein
LFPFITAVIDSDGNEHHPYLPSQYIYYYGSLANVSDTGICNHQRHSWISTFRHCELGPERREEKAIGFQRIPLKHQHHTGIRGVAGNMDCCSSVLHQYYSLLFLTFQGLTLTGCREAAEIVENIKILRT